MTDETLSESEIFSEATERSRDDQGRFASQERQTEPRPQDTRPAEAETPTPNLGQLPETGDQGEGDGQQPQPNEQPQQQPRQVPLSEVQAERKKRQEREADLAARDRELAEMRGQMAAFQQIMQRQAQPAPQPQKQEAPPPDPYDDPAAFAAYQARQVFQSQFQPFADQSRQQQEQFQSVVNNLNRGMAEVQHTPKAVEAAEEAFNTAAARGLIDPLEHRRINSAPNPYAAAVDWHKRQQTHERIGGDPDKWFSSEFERRAKEDPSFQQQMFALLNGQAQQGQQPAAAGQPAAARAPVFTGLPSVNGAAGASARGGPPMSEADIFASVPPKMGGRA